MRSAHAWLTDQSVDNLDGRARSRHRPSTNGGFRWRRTGTASSEAARSSSSRRSAPRSGAGTSEKGYYKDIHASNLLAKAYAELIERAGIDPAEVEDVIAGCVQQFGEQGINIARNAWLEAGLPIETPATTVDRQCGSAQQAVNFAAALVASGVHDVVIGGGVEHMGHISFADSASGDAGARLRLLAAS